MYRMWSSTNWQRNTKRSRWRRLSMISTLMRSSRRKLSRITKKKVNNLLCRRVRVHARNRSTPVHRNHWVCIRISLKYCFLLASVGFVTRSRTTVHSYLWANSTKNALRWILSIIWCNYITIQLFLVFPFFFAINFGVLICMDSLECFLHSLRLHWVEFQNKFYQGKGRVFEPFTFNHKWSILTFK